MADVKISAGADPGTLVATDKVPLARSASTTAYAATMAELAAYANGAYVPSYATSPPLMDGSAAAGTSTFVSRGDHVHPSDTTRAPLASPTFTGTPAAPTATTGTNTTQLATTAFVQSQMVASGAGVSTWNTRAGAVVLQQADITAVGALHDVGRNRLHNAGFSINQRGYTSGTALAAGAYAHDRWKAGSGGCTYTFTQTQPFTTITITAGSLQQIVEAMNVEGGTYTLSWTGTAQGRVNAGTYAASPVTVTGLAVNTAITVEFNTGTLGRIQLEVGSVATPLEKPDPRYDLANCQRFAFMLQSFGFGSGAYSGGIVFYVPFNFPVPMRTNPTASGGTWTGVTNCSATTFASTSQHSALLAITASAIGQVIATLNNALFSADL
jgi:hypothetical protein